MMLTEETEILAEACPGATSSNMRPTGTDLLLTADIHSEPSNMRPTGTDLLLTVDIHSEPSKPLLCSATVIKVLYLCLEYKTDYSC